MSDTTVILISFGVPIWLILYELRSIHNLFRKVVK